MFFLKALFYRVGFICLLALALPVHANSGELGWDKRVIHGTLGNGFRYYLFDSRQEKDHPKGLTIGNLMVFAGANDEKKSQLGVAHMVEHMMFHESDAYPQGVRKALTDMGYRQGRDFNAMTTSENTRFMLNIKQTTEQKLNSALEIYQQIAFHAKIKASSLDTERLIIEEEWRGKLSHRMRVNAEKKALIHMGAFYPDRPVLGTQQSIRTTSADTLRAFYDDWYVPNNMALVIYAPVDMHALEKQVQRVFGKMPAKALPIRHSKDPVLDDNIKLGELKDAGSKVNRVAFLYRFKSEFFNSAEGRRDGVINYMTRRLLSQQVRRQREVLPDHVRTFSSTKGSVSPNVAVLGFSVNVDNGYFDLGLQTLAVELSRLRSHGFYQEDFDQVYQRVTRAAQRNKQAAKNRGSIWSVKMVDAVVKGDPLSDPIDSNNQILAVLNSITLEDVNARLREWLSSCDRLLYTQAVGGKSVDLGTPSSIEALFARYAQEALAPLQKEKVVEQKHLPVVAEKGSAVLQSRDETLGLSRWLLSNGDQLTLLNPHQLAQHSPEILADKKSEFSYFTALSGAGYQVKSGSVWAEQIALQMSEATGIYGWSDETFQQWRKQNKVSLLAKQTAKGLTYRGAIDNGALSTLLATYRVNQVTPKIDEGVYKQVMASLTRKARVPVVRPVEQFATEIAKVRFGEQEALSPTLSRLQHLSRKKLEQVRLQQVALPTHYLMVSSLPESLLLDMARRYLATIPRGEAVDSAFKRREDAPMIEPLKQRKGQYVVDMSINTAPKSEYRLYAYQDMPWSPKAALQLTYLGERLEERLKQQLRSKVQGVYSVRVGLDLNKQTNRAELTVHYSSSPSRLDDLAVMTQNMVANLSSLVTANWAKQVHKEFVGVESNRLKKAFDSTLSHRLELSETLYGDARYLKTMGDLAAALSEEELHAMAQQLVFSDRVVGLFRPLSTKVSSIKKSH